MGRCGVAWPDHDDSISCVVVGRWALLLAPIEIQVVCDWIGNTEAIASKHYLQVTEDHFARAVGQGVPKEGKKEGRQTAVLPRTIRKPLCSRMRTSPVLQRVAVGDKVVHIGRCGVQGPG